MEYLKIRNWDKWQTYRKDRGQPPWIKIHRCVMRNPEWVSLSDAERGQLVGMWLLAADHDGVIPASPELIQKLSFMEDIPNINKFIELGFIEDNGVRLTPTRRQDVTPKAEAEKNRIEEEPAQESGHFKNFITDEWLKAINELGKELEAKRFNPWKWIQKMLGQKKHPGAVHECLYTLLEQYDIIKEPYGFLNHLIKVKDWNWWEKDRISKEQKEKIDFQKMAKEFEAFCKSKP